MNFKDKNYCEFETQFYEVYQKQFLKIKNYIGLKMCTSQMKNYNKRLKKSIGNLQSRICTQMHLLLIVTLYCIALKPSVNYLHKGNASCWVRHLISRRSDSCKPKKFYTFKKRELFWQKYLCFRHLLIPLTNPEIAKICLRFANLSRK